MRKVTRLCQASGVVCNRTECVDRHCRSYKGQHSKGSQGNAVGSTDLSGNEEGYGDEEHRKKTASASDGVSLCYYKGLSFSCHACQDLGGLEVCTCVILCNNANGHSRKYSQYSTGPRGCPSKKERRRKIHIPKKKEA